MSKFLHNLQPVLRRAVMLVGAAVGVGLVAVAFFSSLSASLAFGS